MARQHGARLHKSQAGADYRTPPPTPAHAGNQRYRTSSVQTSRRTPLVDTVPAVAVAASEQKSQIRPLIGCLLLGAGWPVSLG
jgi:hypothetical protein